MKAGTKIWIGIMIFSLFSAVQLSAQDGEYDDLYFNKSDRKAKKEKKYQPTTSEENVVKSDVPLTTEEFSSKNINPEYIARYKADELENETSGDNYTSDDYYVETDKRIDKNQQAILDSGNTKYSNNLTRPDYYRYPNNYANNRYGYGINPYYCPAGWNVGLGYTFGSFYGMPYSGYNVSMTWSSGGYGYSPYSSWYNPWYDPWYDPWYGGFGYPSYASRWSVGFGFGFGYYNYYRPYNYYPTYVVIGEGNSNVHYGRRDSRTSSSTAVRNYPDRNQTASTSKNIKLNDNTGSINTRTRDYSKLQNEYYRTNNRSVNATNSVDRSSYTNRSSVSRSPSNDRIISSTSNSRVSNNSTYTSRPSRSNNYYNSSNNSGRTGYSTPSRSNSGSNYYTPSRSNSSSYSNRSYSRPSSGRSSSYSSGSSGSRSSSYTPSRSSGNSSSYSRSSSSSSSSRSSSSSSSSGSRRR